jgi:hypothetical protein
VSAPFGAERPLNGTQNRRPRSSSSPSVAVESGLTTVPPEDVAAERALIWLDSMQ